MPNQVKSQPSPGPGWVTLPVSQDTPDVSDEDDTDKVENELLGTTPRKRKKQAADISNDAKRVRYQHQVSQEETQSERGSKEFNPLSSIQVTSRQHPSPGFTRTGRGIEVHSVPGSSKRTNLNVAPGIAGGSGHLKDRAVIDNTGNATARRDAAFVMKSGQTISRPSIARKKTARKYATNALNGSNFPSAPSAVTRPVQRTREEKKRQNSISSSSDSLPYSSTAPVKTLNCDTIADKQKAAHSIKSSQPMSSAGSRKSGVPRRPPEIIDITSDGESESISQAGKPKPLVISSGAKSKPKRHNNAQVSPRHKSTAQETPREVIEILDSDDEPDSSSKTDIFEEDMSVPQDIQAGTMDELDQLSLFAAQSPQDGALVPLPESASESSGSVTHSGRDSSSDPCGSNKESVSPLLTSINSDGKADMDHDPIIPSFQEDKGAHLCQDIQTTSTASDSEQSQSSDTLPGVQHSTSPSQPNRRSLSSNIRELNAKLALQKRLKLSQHGGVLKSSVQENKLAQKSTSDQTDSIGHRSGVISQRRNRLSCDEVDIHEMQAADSSLLAMKNNHGRNLSLPTTPFVDLQGKAELPTPMSSGMNLADAITQASQHNNRMPVRNSPRTETAPEATGKPVVCREEIEKSQRFMKSLQNSVSQGPRHKQQQLDTRLTRMESVTGHHSFQKQLEQRPEVPLIDSGSSGNSRQSSSEVEKLEDNQQPTSVENPLALSGSPARSNGHATEESTKDIPIQESDDELEYIDENDVVQGLASIGITNQAVSGEVVDDHLNFVLEQSPKDAVPIHGSMTRSHSPDLVDMFSAMGDGEVTIPPPTSGNSTPLEAVHSQIPLPIQIEGFTVLNWRDFRQDLDNFLPNYYVAKDLPHTLQDHINHMSEWTRSLPDMRVVFTAAIQENTAPDEPDAPPIQVENLIDDEPAPPWEFHYSNQMWHGEGVPPPDIKNLISCDCIGRCDPRSKTCACVRRQREAFEDPNADFAYDNKGKLKELGYPIFECNDLCGCDDDCRNRVVQHGRTCMISIRKTANKGWGVFADQKKIYKGTFIGVYAGEIITDEAGEERGLKYDKLGKTYLFDIDFHHLHKDQKDWTSKYTVDAYHSGNFTRFLNHSCDPNCTLVPCYINEGNIDKPLLTVFARRDIEPGEELCFSYCGADPDDDDNMNASDDIDKQKNGAVYAKCYCGAKNCKGRLFG